MSRRTVFFWAALLLVLALFGARLQRPQVEVSRIRHVILISIDTLRADRLGSYGQNQMTSPFYDRLARGSVQFAEAISPSSWTGSAHMSMFTGVEPQRHGLVAYPFYHRLEYPDPMLAEILKAHGFATAAFHGGAPLIDEIGFGRGFDVYETHGLHFADNREAMLKWVLGHRDVPMFLFLHGFDVHQPYCPPFEYGSQFTDVKSNLEMMEFCRQIVTWKPETVDEEQLDYVKGQYMGNVRTHDPLMSLLLYELDQIGVLDQSLLVVTSDHGEAFYEHGRCGHAHGLYDELLRVPLLFRFPHGEYAGRVVGDQVASSDLLPTILDVLQIPTPVNVTARSLLPAIRGERLIERPVVGATGFPAEWDDMNCQDFVRYDRWKLIHKRGAKKATAVELYDLLSDPLETTNLADAGIPQAGMLSRMLEAVPARGQAMESIELTDEIRQQLEGIGYMSAGQQATQSLPTCP